MAYQGESIALNIDTRGFMQGIAQAQTAVENFKSQLKNGVETKIGFNATGIEKDKAKILEGFEQIKQGAEQVKTGVSQVGSVMSKLGVVAVGAIGASAKGYADFTQQMKRNGAIMGASVQDMKELEKSTREYAQTATFSGNASQDIARGYEYMAMAGWNAQDSMKAMPSIINGVTVSGEDFGLVADIVTDQLTAFGLSASDSSHFMDVLTNATTKSNTNIAGLGEALKYVGPLAGQLGFSIEDVSASLGLMANAGIKGSQAGTSLRAMFTKLSSASPELREQMNALGVSFTDSNGKMLPLKNILDQLRGATEGMTEAQKLQLAQTLAGQEGMSGLSAILGATNEDYNKLFNSMQDVDGLSEKMAQDMGDTLSGSINKLKNSLKEAGLSIGEALAPSLAQLAQKITELVQAFNNLDKETQEKIAKVIATLAGLTVVAPILSNVATLVKGSFNILSGSFTMLKGSFTALSGMFGLLKPLLLSCNPVVLGVVAGFGLLVATNKDLRESLGNLFKALGNVVKTLIDALKPALVPIVGALQDIILALKPLIEILTGVLGTALSKVVDVLTFIINTILVPLIKIILPPLTIAIGAIATAIQIVAQVAGSVFTFLKEGFLMVFSFLKGNLDEAKEHATASGEAIKGIGANVTQTLIDQNNRSMQAFGINEEQKASKSKEVASDIEKADIQKSNTLIENNKRVTEDTKQGYNSVQIAIQNYFKHILEGWKQNCIAIIDAWEWAKTGIVETAHNMSSKIKTAFGDFTRVGKNIVYDIWDGMASKLNWLWNRVSNFFSDLSNSVSSWISDISPFSLNSDFDTYSLRSTRSIQPMMLYRARTPQVLQETPQLYANNMFNNNDFLKNVKRSGKDKGNIVQNEDNRKINIEFKTTVSNDYDADRLTNKVKEVIMDYIN